MKPSVIVTVMICSTVAAGAGYWLGLQHNTKAGLTPVTSALMDAPVTETPAKQPKLLYYRNPMGLPDTSSTPKKDPMGMDYIPVYEGEQEADAETDNWVKINTEKVQKLGVRTELAERRLLGKVVRAAGRVELDERRVYSIAPKFEGYVELLHVNITGQPVTQGQPLFEVYSPELVSAQQEYAIALQGVESLKSAIGQTREGMQQLADSSLQRLKNWDIPPEQVRALASSGEVNRTLTFRSPVTGIVMDKMAVQGMRFMPGEVLYRVADLSAVWVLADVFEQEIGRVKQGAKAKVRINAYPDRLFEGLITYVYPTLNAQTRTVPIRIELPNPGQLLKPAMFARVELPVGSSAPVLTVPASAVIDSGTRQIVLIQQAEGRFEPREVRLGERSDDYVEVLDGLEAGQPVVVSANFLIDAESNLMAAIQGFSAAPATDTPAPAAVGYQTEGIVESLDLKAGTVMLQHDSVPDLKWPAMTMEFQVANTSLLTMLQPASRIRFDFVERSPGEWVITAIEPLLNASASSTTDAKVNPHAGH